ncbi:hypothetical protein ACEWY4_023638 [Coilia grayii]|uniref:Uncharacterized protein n=1 Tax=Coilia grayii TaxID=363190 RepID=A0ABD1J0N6_9TELE
MSPLSSENFVGADSRLESCGGCGVSLSSDTSPLLLPCLHSLCRSCMPNHGVAGCPVCAMLYSPDDVTPNPLFFDVSPMSPSQKCGGCDCSTVEGCCVECGEALCVECVSAHRRVRMTRDHTIHTQITTSGFAWKKYCPIHKDEPYKLYCLTCAQLTCRDCQLMLHRNHSFQFVGEVVSERRQKLEALVNRVKEQRAYTQRSLYDLEGRLLDLDDVLAAFKEDMKRALMEIRDMLIQAAMKLMADAKCARYPDLALAARKYLSAQPTSVDSKRLFSAASDVIDDKRNRILCEKAEMLLFVKMNFAFVKNKLLIPPQ